MRPVFCSKSNICLTKGKHEAERKTVGLRRGGADEFALYVNAADIVEAGSGNAEREWRDTSGQDRD